MAEVAFCGEQFQVAEKIGLMPLMRFAKVAKSGADSADLESLTVMLDLLEQCIAPSDWQRFQDVADRERADGDELMRVVAEVFVVISQRPTSRPSDSSAGPSTIVANSTVGSSSRVIERYETMGRPDLALLVTQAQEQLTG